MVAVLEVSPVPKSICLMSASFGGAMMLGFLADICIVRKFSEVVVYSAAEALYSAAEAP